jgi:hypothetical protein
MKESKTKTMPGRLEGNSSGRSFSRAVWREREIKSE